MSIKQITVMVEPIQPGEKFTSESFPNPKSIYEAAKYLQLFNELKEGTTAKVTLLEDVVQAAPPSGMVMLYPRYRGIIQSGHLFAKVLDECTPEFRKRLGLLNVAPAEAYEILEQYELAVVVEDMDYSYWWDIERGIIRRQRMHGLTVVAEEIGATIRSQREKYCYMAGEVNERLPALLIRYLEAYVRMVPGISNPEL